MNVMILEYLGLLGDGGLAIEVIVRASELQSPQRKGGEPGKEQRIKYTYVLQ